MFKKLVWIPLVSVVSACSPLGLVNGISRVHDVEERPNIAYGTLDRQQLDLYLPKVSERRTNAQGKTPAILFFYGGSWNSGSRADYRFVGRRLASEGYIVGVADYRLYPEVRYPDFLHDSAGAVKKFVELIRSDALSEWQPEAKITLMGHSAGAYNTAMMALDPRWLKEQGMERADVLKNWVGMAGPYDLYPIVLEDVKPVFFYPDYPSESNPIEFIEQSDIPALLLAPENDDLIDTERHTIAFAKKLLQAGKLVELQSIKGTSHTTLIGTMSPLLFFKGSSVEVIKEFLDRR